MLFDAESGESRSTFLPFRNLPLTNDVCGSLCKDLHSDPQSPVTSGRSLADNKLSSFSIEEIGQQLGVSRPTAKKYLARALTHCRDAEDLKVDKDAR